MTTKKAVVDADKKKGELMENDQDAMEVIVLLLGLFFPGPDLGICVAKLQVASVHCRVGVMLLKSL